MAKTKLKIQKFKLIGHELTTIQLGKFTESYNGKASESAATAGLNFAEESPKDEFYVYGLVDSLTDELFYIGKGHGGRMFNHVLEQRRKGIPNARKFNRIRLINKEQGHVRYLIFYTTQSEKLALWVEYQLIQLIGRRRLTNVMGGTELQEEKDAAYALRLLSNLKPDDGKRGKYYPQLREFLIKAVRHFGYNVNETASGQIEISNTQTT